MKVLVIYNPVCGDRTAAFFFTEHVRPLLIHLSPQIVPTSHPQHAGNIVSKFLADFPSEEVALVLCSGDGTLHEVIEHIYASLNRPLPIALVPCGTANALYSSLFSASSSTDVEYRLQSVRSLLSGKPWRVIPLTLAKTTRFSSDSRVLSSSISCVVASTCLHASILHDSEELREASPGIERFKIAARRNSDRWYRGNLRLSCNTPSPVLLYSPEIKAFVPHPNANPPNSLTLSGPFVYILSTVNVDRLEPQFRITPLSLDCPCRSEDFPNGHLEVVIIRPFRDPSVCIEGSMYDSDFLRKTEAARSAFSQRTWTVMGAAYADGTHVNLKYTNDPQCQVVNDASAKGATVVEYLRCTSWEWTPISNDPRERFLCVDGTISEVENGGRIECASFVQENITLFV
ncbi:hypothetical protein FISHEDRAFT_38504 [Fistulina hepatica ATCC 64428]|nr:hypothetical protein FISHEDRAFT_38504 [Fistulina hepatica ATCC 64428]